MPVSKKGMKDWVESPERPECYVYTKLKSSRHIRLITLQPSEEVAANLRCVIEQHDLGTVIDKYEAISYTWGEPVFSRTLHCDDGTILKITANLDAALRRFRSKNPIVVWADAVSINQKDDGEKPTQIPLMGEIYRNAKQVLVWLGEGLAGEQQTTSTLNYFSRNNPFRGAFSPLQGVDEDIKLALRQFWTLPWFSRRWIIQEVVRNFDVRFFCGDETISWHRLMGVVKMFRFHSDVNPSFGALSKMSVLWTRHCEGEGGGASIFDMLGIFDYFQCADARDRLFSLVGLAGDVRLTREASTEELPLPNDRKVFPVCIDYSTDAQSVYTAFAISAMRNGHTRDILEAVLQRKDASQMPGLPSWVPDWTAPKTNAVVFQPNPSVAVEFPSSRCVDLTLPSSYLNREENLGPVKITHKGPGNFSRHRPTPDTSGTNASVSRVFIQSAWEFVRESADCSQIAEWTANHRAAFLYKILLSRYNRYDSATVELLDYMTKVLELPEVAGDREPEDAAIPRFSRSILPSLTFRIQDQCLFRTDTYTTTADDNTTAGTKHIWTYYGVGNSALQPNDEVVSANHVSPYVPQDPALILRPTLATDEGGGAGSDSSKTYSLIGVAWITPFRKRVAGGCAGERCCVIPDERLDSETERHGMEFPRADVVLRLV